MLELIVRPEAEADINQISDYTEAQWGTAQAKKYVEAINAAIKRIASFPGLGAPADGLPEAYRKLATGSHRVFYRVAADKLIVVRILHERQDVPAEFGDS